MHRSQPWSRSFPRRLHPSHAAAGEDILGQIADAVNEATPGKIIAGSEEKVRDLFADLRQEAFKRAVQMRVDAAEAAFPPSEGGQDAKMQTQ